MTNRLQFRASAPEPVASVLPPLTERDRVRAYMMTQFTEAQVEQLLRGWDLVSIARRRLGIDK